MGGLQHAARTGRGRRRQSQAPGAAETDVGGLAAALVAVGGTSGRHRARPAARPSRRRSAGRDPSAGRPAVGRRGVPGADRRAYDLGPLRRRGIDGAARPSSSWTRSARRRSQPTWPLRPAFGLPAPVLAAGHPAGRAGAALPADQQPVRLGLRDHAGRRVGARDGARPRASCWSRRRPRRTRARPGSRRSSRPRTTCCGTTSAR